MSDNEKVYYEMTPEQAKAIREMVERLTQFVQGNYADLLGAKDALMTTVDVLPDTRPEKRLYWVKFKGEVEDIEIEIDINNHLDVYSVNGRSDAIRDNIPDEFLPMVDEYSVTVDDAHFDDVSEVYVNGSYEVMIHEVSILIDPSLSEYCDEAREKVIEAVFEMHPDLDMLEFSDYGHISNVGRVTVEEDEDEEVGGENALAAE